MARILPVLTFLMLGTWSIPSHAFTAICVAAVSNDQSGFGGPDHIGVYSNIPLDCVMPGKKTKQGRVNHAIDFNLRTYGPGLEFFMVSTVLIECPLVSKKRLSKVLNKKGRWGVVGVGASAGALLLGARVGLGVNHRGALCTVTGLSIMDLGAAAGAIELSTYDKDFLETMVVSN